MDFRTSNYPLLLSVSASFRVSPALEIPNNVLKPAGGEAENTRLLFGGLILKFSTNSGIGFDANTGLSLNYPAEIANSGFTIDFNHARLDLSKTTSLPEILAAGYPPDFMGVFIEYAAIGLPAILQTDENIPSGQQAQIIGQNLIIGTGGFSGKIILDDSGNQLGLRLGSQNGFSLQFESFTATFQQNAIIESEVPPNLWTG